MNNKTLKLLLSLFALNSITLYLYLSSHHHRDHRTELPSGDIVRRDQPAQRRQLTLKPWPILPSYLPWTGENSKVAFRSCESYFGNGYTEIADPLKRPTSGIRRRSVRGGWFRCSYSETLRSSVCEGGGVKMMPDKILMSRGGEKIESVIGRAEDEELPRFEDGAFEIEADDSVERSRIGEKLVDDEFLNRYVPRGAIERHTMRGLIGSMRLVGRGDFTCSEWIEEPTILVTRFEYANVFHTVTDWYSAYVASRVAGFPNRPNLIFVDGHSETQLEETWRALFSSITYAKNLTGPVCFRHVVLSPLGYETALFKGLTENINCQGASSRDLWRKPEDAKTARISEFGEMIRASFGLPADPHRTARRPAAVRTVLFVRREDYIAHPRHGGKVQTRLSNEEEVFESVRTWAPSYPSCRVNVVNGVFAHMPMKEQVRAIGDADVIVGAHGAGLTHMVSAGRGAVILEIVSSEYRRPHFALIAAWKGLEYRPIYLDGSRADPDVVVEGLRGILRSIGC